jgi:hypothetical protein
MSIQCPPGHSVPARGSFSLRGAPVNIRAAAAGRNQNGVNGFYLAGPIGRMDSMRFGSSLMALAFLLVAIAAGMWPSWALATASASWRSHAAVTEMEPNAFEHSAYKPCYGAVRIAAVSCLMQLGLPEGIAAHGCTNIRHCTPAAQPHAVKVGVRDADFRPPRPLPFA